MATTLLTDIQVYNEQYQGGYWEGIAQQIALWNAISRGTLSMGAESMKGEYEVQAFWKALDSGVIAHRDTDSTSDVTPIKAEQTEIVSVKVDRRIGPIDSTLDALRKGGIGLEEFSFGLGRRIADRQGQDMLNTGLAALVAALDNVSDLKFDATATGSATLVTKDLAEGLALLGDQAQRVRAWVMHSKVYNDLMKEQMSGDVTNIADRTVYEASVGTLNRPVLISDSPALKTVASGVDDEYHTLGLTENALVAIESESEVPVIEKITGKENLIWRMQSEYAYNLGVKGFTWDTVNGGSNPDDATLATGTNWDKVVTDVKDCAGMVINSN